MGRSSFIQGAVALALGVGALSCGGDAAGPSRAPVAAVTLMPSSSNLALGATLPMQATARDADGNVLSGREIFFASNNENVATVSENGVVTARAIGNAQIAASSEGRSAIATVNVIPPPVATVTVLPAVAQTTVGGSVKLTAATYDAAGNLLTNRQTLWSSSNTGVATVDGQGLVRGVGLGSVTITATSEGKSGSASVTVALIPIATISVTPPTAQLNPGEQTQLTAVARDASGNVLAGRLFGWLSSVPSVAGVSQSGLVSAVSAGSAVITASAEGKSATAVVTVAATTPPPTIDRVTISPRDWEPKVGQTKQFVAKAFDQSGREIPNVVFTWTSTNILRVTVTQGGFALAISKGDADIRVSAGGKSAKADVEVE